MTGCFVLSFMIKESITSREKPANNSNTVNDENIAITDKLLEYKCISSKKLTFWKMLVSANSIIPSVS